jgi:hypothetical protein
MSENESIVEYREIPDYPGYRAGSDGTIWTLWKSVNMGHRKGCKMEMGDKWTIKKTHILKNGYFIVNIHNHKGRHTRLVHQLILETFVGPKPKSLICRHLDGTKTNNNRTNLTWGTDKENSQDTIAHGRANRGEKNPLAKISKDDVLEIRRRRRLGESTIALAKFYGLNQCHVNAICVGASWAWVPGALGKRTGKPKDLAVG